jgi:hypothetical protein
MAGFEVITEEIVNHSEKEYVRGEVHTGTIDGYWGLLKRGLIGTFHRVSIKAPASLPVGISVQVEQSRESGNLRVDDCRSGDKERVALQSSHRPRDSERSYFG